MIGFREVDEKNWVGNLRKVASRDVLCRIDNMEVDWDREISSSGGLVVTGDEGFESRLLLAGGIGSKMTTTLATGRPGHNAGCLIIRDGRAGHYNSGERKEGSKGDRETKEHGERERRTFRERWGGGVGAVRLIYEGASDRGKTRLPPEGGSETEAELIVSQR